MQTANEVFAFQPSTIDLRPICCLELDHSSVNGHDTMPSFRFSQNRCALFALALLITIFVQSAAKAQRINLDDFGPATGNETVDPIEARATVESRLVPVVQEGQSADETDTFAFQVEVTLPPQFYLYSTDPTLGGTTQIEVTDVVGLEPIDTAFTPDRKPKVVFDTILKESIGKYYDNVVWSMRFRLKPGADRDGIRVSGRIKEAQYCTDPQAGGLCKFIRPPMPEALLNASFAPDATPVAQKPESESLPVISYRYEEAPSVFGKTPVRVTVALAPETALPGDTVTLSVTLDLEEDYFTYSVSMPEGRSATPTSISLDAIAGLKPLSEAWIPSSPARKKIVELSGKEIEQETHHGSITWTREFQLNESVGIGAYGVQGVITYQTCDSVSCQPPANVKFAIGELKNAVPVNFQNNGQPVPVTDDVEGAVAKAGEELTKGGMLPFILTGVIAGFLALLTPCVFPMIPITVSFFLKQSDKENHRPIIMALVYCLTIVFTFTIPGVIVSAVYGVDQINALANNTWMNFFIAAVLVFFGLNMLGMFEIRVPAGLLTWSAGKEAAGGYLGVFFMAVTFTLVSFTCTFAFAGTVLAVASQGEFITPIVGMLSFSIAFALPFFFLALFPSYLQKIPKSGGWMNRVKVTMGMIEVGAAVKFLSVADIGLFNTPMFLDSTMVLTIWIVLCALTGLYLLGFFNLPHDTPSESVSVLQLGFATAFLGLALFLTAGVFAPQKPDNVLWSQIASFLPPEFETSRDEQGQHVVEHDGLEFLIEYDKAVALASKVNRPLFLDFTGVNCVNCRLMEDRMTKPYVKSELEKFVLVQLYTDIIPIEQMENEEEEALLEQNRKLQTEWFGDATLPGYAVVTPDGKVILESFIGLTEAENFAEFLKRGFAKWEQQGVIANNPKTTLR